MTASLGNFTNPPYASQIDASVYPQFIGYSERPPTSNDIYTPGTQIQDNSVSPPVIYETTGNGVWYSIAGNAGTVTGTTAATINGRSGQVTITTPTINAGATFTFTITNSLITSSSKQVMYTLTGGTTGAALTIKSVTNSANTSAVVIMNGTGATNNSASLTLTFLVLN